MKELNRTALEQLQSYVDHRDDPDRGGWYYGNREQFEKRHLVIKEWLKAKIELAAATPAVRASPEAAREWMPIESDAYRTASGC